MNKKLSDNHIIKNQIYTIRGVKVMLDRDLAELYQVETKVLNQAVKRNEERFPKDFMFHPTPEELNNLKSQIVTSSWGGSRKQPFAFTEQGIAMLSGILRSKIAIEINIRIMRAFVEIRQIVSIQPEYEDLKIRVKQIESQMDAIVANDTVDKIMLEKKLLSMSSNIHRISETLDRFQDGHIVIQRPDDEINQG